MNGEVPEIESAEKLRGKLRTGGIIFAVLAGLWLMVVLWIGFTKAMGFETVGQVGDSMAFVAVLAAALGLGATAYSLVLQRQDIGVQISEMAKAADAARELAEKEGQAILLRKWEQVISACDTFEREVIRDLEEARTATMYNQELAVQVGNKNFGFLDGAKVGAAATNWALVLAGLSDKVPSTIDPISMEKDKALTAIATPNIADEKAADVILESLRSIRSGWRQDLGCLKGNPLF